MFQYQLVVVYIDIAYFAAFGAAYFISRIVVTFFFCLNALDHGHLYFAARAAEDLEFLHFAPGSALPGTVDRTRPRISDLEPSVGIDPFDTDI